jgi:hypothetical protein
VGTSDSQLTANSRQPSTKANHIEVSSPAAQRLAFGIAKKCDACNQECAMRKPAETFGQAEIKCGVRPSVHIEAQ